MLAKNSFLLRHKKIIVLFSLILILFLIVLLITLFGKSKANEVFASSPQLYTVSSGNVVTSITGSGVIQSSNTKSVSTEVSADILNVYVNVGDTVSKGDILFELDKSSYNSQIRSEQKNVDNFSKNVSSYQEDIKNLNIYAEKSGYVTDFNSKLGDTVNKNSSILNITNDDYYYLDCYFYYNSNVNIKVSDKASILTQGSLSTLDGVVSFVSQYKEVSNEGTPLQKVTIKIANPGYSLNGIYAIATIYTDTLTIKSIEYAKISEEEAYTQKALSSGTIEKINVKNGDYIEKGQLIITLSNDDLYDNLSDAKTNLLNAYEDLNDIKETYDFYTITSPIDGVVSSINYSVGDYVREESVLANIINTTDLEFSISVDELEILDVELGQEVEITIDALEETEKTPIIGYVSEIAIEGTSQNSVTTYPVTISLSGSENIKIGFNCSAKIITSSAKDVLVVPVEAINSKKGKYTVSLEDGSQKEVNVGIYDEDYIEIISGLSLGDIIKLPETVQNKASSNTNNTGESRGNGSSFGMPNMGGNFNGGFQTNGNSRGGNMPMGF